MPLSINMVLEYLKDCRSKIIFWAYCDQMRARALKSVKWLNPSWLPLLCHQKPNWVSLGIVLASPWASHKVVMILHLTLKALESLRFHFSVLTFISLMRRVSPSSALQGTASQVCTVEEARLSAVPPEMTAKVQWKLVQEALHRAWHRCYIIIIVLWLFNHKINLTQHT